MKAPELKKFIIESLYADSDPEEIAGKLDNEGVSYRFRNGFTDKVIDKIFSTSLTVTQEMEFVKSMNYVFYRIALTGVAAIVILLISIYLMQGSVSFNSFLGISDTYDESIISLLTGN
jgi:hypothetical protein